MNYTTETWPVLECFLVRTGIEMNSGKMIRFDKVYQSSLVSVLLISSEYDSDYSENDYNSLPSVSFPLSGGFGYKSAGFNGIVDTNTVLIEKENIEFDVSKFSEFGGDITLSFQFLENGFDRVHSILSDGEVVQILRRSLQTECLLRHFLSIYRRGSKLLIDQIIHELLVENIFNRRPPAFHIRAVNPWHRRKIDTTKDYIHAHYSQDLTLADLSSVANISVFHFSRIFREVTGHSPYNYLLEVRILQACRLLMEGRSVTATAFDTGFNSIANFSSRFKKIIGVSPSMYKKSKNSKIF